MSRGGRRRQRPQSSADVQQRRARDLFVERRERRRGTFWALAIGAAACIGWFFTREADFWSAPVDLRLFIVGLGCATVMHGVWDVYQQLRARRWPAAPCRIELVEVDHRRGVHSVVSFLTVYYSYTVAGKNYVSRQLHIGSSGSIYSEARRARYAVGQQKRCYYDPRNPANAVLERHFALTWPLLALVCGTYFAVMGLAIET